MQVERKKKKPGGRPPKFSEPSRPVTVTLPQRTLDRLAKLDPDRARAIVKAVDSLTGPETALAEHEIAPAAHASSLLIVPACVSLRQLDWLQLLEVVPGRHLLAVTPGTTLEQIEIGLSDLIDDAPDQFPDELDLLLSLRNALNGLRRGQQLEKSEILVIPNP